MVGNVSSRLLPKRLSVKVLSVAIREDLLSSETDSKYMREIGLNDRGRHSGSDRDCIEYHIWMGLALYCDFRPAPRYDMQRSIDETWD